MADSTSTNPAKSKFFLRRLDAVRTPGITSATLTTAAASTHMVFEVVDNVSTRRSPAFDRISRSPFTADDQYRVSDNGGPHPL